MCHWSKRLPCVGFLESAGTEPSLVPYWVVVLVMIHLEDELSVDDLLAGSKFLLVK